jgi:hypothetical protein
MRATLRTTLGHSLSRHLSERRTKTVDDLSYTYTIQKHTHTIYR